MLTLVGAIYDAALDANLWPSVAEGFSTFLGGAATTIAYHDGTRYPEYYGAGLQPEAMHAYAGHYFAKDPILPAVLTAAPGVYTDEMIVEKRDLLQSEFYNDFAVAFDMHSTVAAIPFREPGRSGLFTSARSIRRGSYGDGEIAAMTLLLPHLGRAMRLHLMLRDQDLRTNATADALDSLSHPTLLLDAEARILFANHAAERLLRMRDGLAAGRDGLVGATPADTTALRRLIAAAGGRAGNESVGGSLALPRPSGRRSLAALATPLRQATLPGWMPVARPAVLLTLTDPEPPAPPGATHAQALFGLTPAEAALAAAIGRGGGVKQAARALGIAPSTARTHLHRVFAKTGTGRQAELAALLARLG